MAAGAVDTTDMTAVLEAPALQNDPRSRLATEAGWNGFETDEFRFPEQPQSGKTLARRSVELGGLAVLLLLVSLGLKSFVVDTFRVPSESMSPTVQVGERFAVNRLAYRFDAPAHREVVVFERPASAPVADDLLVKRIVALGGEVVEARDGTLLVNGIAVDESEVPPTVTTEDFGPVSVPLEHVFLLGDNRGASIDSRTFGPVPESLLVGRALIRIWPLDRVGGLGASQAD